METIGQRPADNRRDAAPAGRIFIQPRAAGNKFRRNGGVADLEPRQHRRRQASQPQRAGRAVGTTDIVVGPRRKPGFILVDFELIPECQCDLPAAARGAVEESCRTARRRRRRRNISGLMIHRCKCSRARTRRHRVRRQSPRPAHSPDRPLPKHWLPPRCPGHGPTPAPSPRYRATGRSASPR